MTPVDRWALERMGIPPRLWGVTYGVMPEPLHAPVRRYVSDIDKFLSQGSGFYIHGPAGVGKTSAAIVLLKAGWERQHTGYYITVKDLRQAVKDDSEFEGGESILARCKSVDLLVLDDLAQDDFRPFTLGLGEIEHLVGTRAARGKTTILPTRLPPSAFLPDYGSFLSTLEGNFVAISLEKSPNMKAAQGRSLSQALGV